MAAVWLGFHGGTTELEGVKVWGDPRACGGGGFIG
jgi:hypothetical protein